MGIHRIILYIIIFTVCGSVGIFLPKWANCTFDSSKLALMFIGTSTACILWSITGFNKGIFYKTKEINYSLLLYLLCGITSAAFSYNWVISFFGGFKQHGGVLSLLIYLAFFYLSANFINRQNIHLVFRCLVIIGTLCCLYGICQLFEIGRIASLPMSGRVYSTFGQPTFFGCFLAMTIPIVLYEIARTKKLYLYGILLLLIFSLFIAQSRAGFVAVIIVSIPLIFIYKGNQIFKMITLFTFIVVFIGCIYMNLDFLYADNLYIRFVDGYSARIGFYNEAWNATMAYPFFGVGQDNIRPHNLFLDHLAKLGIVGLLSFCLLGFLAIKNILKINIAIENRNMFYTLIAVCLTYLVFRQFNPGYMPITLIFVMSAGAIYGIKNNSN